jgi:hypothetical protein
MDETVTPELVVPQETTTTTTDMPAMSLQQTVRNAAEFGWSIAELLGRCFALEEEQEKTPVIDWSSGKLVTLQGTLNPPEKLRALAEHLLYLADTLYVSSCIIDHDPDPDNGKRYIDVIRTNVKLLSRSGFDPARDGSFEQIRGKINERLFFWDLKIHDALQDRPAVVHKAYLVGYSLGTLRWCFGLQNKLFDDTLMGKVLHEYIPALGPYVSQFTTGGLVYSVEPWWKAISSQQVKPGPGGPEGLAPSELQRQGHIWYSLVTGESDALSYVDPSIKSRPYLSQVLPVIWPFFVIGGLILLVVIALVVIVILLNQNVVIKGIAAAAGLLTTLGIAQILGNNAGNIVQKAVTDATASIKGSYLDQIWNSTLQKAVNQGIYIPPAGVNQNQKTGQNPSVK